MLAFFLLAMFVVSNAVAAAHACIEGLPPLPHEALQVANTDQPRHECSSPDDAGDQTRCAQNDKNDEPKFSNDVPPALAFVPALAVPRDWFDTVLVIASTTRQLPTRRSLTILFGNFRI